VTHPVSDKSIVDLLKQDYEDVATDHIVYLPITGWERTGLAIKYRHPHSGVELDAVARKVFQEIPRNEQYNRGFAVALDTIIKLNEGLYVKPPGAKNYVELDPEEAGRALDLGDGEKLSPIFGWNGEVKSARDVVRKLFGNNHLSIIAHSEKLQRWLVDTKADLNTEIWQMGELTG
jgi:hypothetical protein